MSLIAAPLASLFLFSSFAIAQVSAPNCSITWQWAFNSLGQDPCTIAAYMMSTCNGGSFTITPLLPGNTYFGPDGVDDANLCKCSTVGYALTSACSGCQGAQWITWSQYSFNCTQTLPPSEFPNPIPAGTRVPQWVLLDPTHENLWDFNKSYAIGDNPELGPGTILGPSGPSVSGSATATPLATGATGGHSSDGGAIAGGIVGGIATISLVVAAFFLYRRRRRSLAPSGTSAGDAALDLRMDQVPRSLSDDGTVTPSLPDTSTAFIMKTYNPDDPSTFPLAGFPGSPNLQYSPSAAPTSSSRNLYTVASVPGSPYHDYRGLPTV